MHRLFSSRCLILGTVLVASVQAHGQTDKPNAAPVEALIKYGFSLMLNFRRGNMRREVS